MQQLDVPGIGGIERQTLSPWTPAMLLGELRIKNGMQLVAYAPSGDLLGWCCSRFVVPEAELLKIAVAQGVRRSGVGSLLFNSLCHRLRLHSVSTLLLEVRSGSRVALDFYEELGFVEVGKRRQYYTDPIDDALILQKEVQ